MLSLSLYLYLNMYIDREGWSSSNFWTGGYLNTVLIRFDPFFGGYDWRDDVPIVPSTVVIDTGHWKPSKERYRSQ